MEEALRCIPQPLTTMRSHSFYRYFHLLKQLGWVEATGEEEPSFPGGMPGARGGAYGPGNDIGPDAPAKKVLILLTAKGREASPSAWSDPLQAVYGYPREFRSRRKPSRTGQLFGHGPGLNREPRQAIPHSPSPLPGGFLFFKKSVNEHISSSS